MNLQQDFGLLCEGFQLTFIPESACIRQGGKVFVCWDDNKTLTESLEGDTNVTLVESIDDLDCEEVLIEGKKVKHPKDATWEVEGPYQRSDTENANKRKYKRKIWERIIGDPKSAVQRALREGGGLLGHLEHPADGRMNGKEGAIATRSLTLREDGVVWGKSDVLSTPNGLILQEYTRKNVRWGVSSRGNGSVDAAGNVNEDYQLETFDAVMKPSTPGAYPQPVNSDKKRTVAESAELTEDAKECVLTVEALKTQDVETLDESAKTKFIADVFAALGSVNSLAKSDALPKAQAYDLQNWLMTTLKGVHESTDGEWEAAIEQALNEAQTEGDDDEQREAAFRRLVAGFEKRVADAVGESTQLRSELSEAETLVTEVQEQIDVLTEERDEALALLVETQERLADTERQLETAQAVLASGTEQDVEDSIQQAVAEAVESVPDLEAYRSVLEGAESPERVNVIAEALLPVITRNRQAERHESARTTPVPASRPALPTGVIVESDAGATSRKATGNPSRGAAMAGKVLAKQSAKQ